ncbi:MAG: transglycosylase SLT domain-containing protein, partial [Gemmatimonadota bacterium]
RGRGMRRGGFIERERYEPYAPYRGEHPDAPVYPGPVRGTRAGRRTGRAPGGRAGPRFAYDAAEPERRAGRRRRGIDRRSAHERRSGIDRRTGAVQGAGWIQRGREVLARLREPIIGLTVAAAAAPIARQQGIQAPTKGPATRPATPERAAAATPEADLEERLGERWAAAAEERVREDTVEGAILRYGITRDLAEDIYDTAVDEGIEPEIAFGLVNTESAFRPRAVSSVGARGLTQLMPATAGWLQPGLSGEQIFDRDTNLRLGFRYLNQLIDQYDGDLRLALLAYNRGPGTVDRVLARGGNPDNGYADMVLGG